MFSKLFNFYVAKVIGLDNYRNNSEWNIVETKCEFNLYIYFEVQQYPQVICSLTIERRSSIYRYTVYLPVLCALLLNLMSLFLDTRSQLRFHLSGLSFITLLIIVLYLGLKLGFGHSLAIPKVSKCGTWFSNT